MSVKSIYIHIPFCIEKCNYCSFVSFPMGKYSVGDYFIALYKEIEAKLTANQVIETIYIGGGTPSLISIDFYEKLITLLKQHIILHKDYELTIEINPATVNREYLLQLKNLGFNRVSFGIQSFNDEILLLLNRKHNSEQAIEAVSMAKDVGFCNISIDLIYGLPRQDMNIWSDTLNQALGLDINHISSYGLKIEDGTVFGIRRPQGLPDEDLCADMYLLMVEKLKKAGFYQYEISNFAQNGYESKHNINYWENKPYYGLGIAAHGYIDGLRYSNKVDFEGYIKTPSECLFENRITREECLEEAVFLGLRMTKGINLNKFEEKYGINLQNKFKHIIEKYEEPGLLVCQNGFLRLTTQGFLLSNTVLADFMNFNQF